MKYLHLILCMTFFSGCSKPSVVDIFLKNIGTDTLIGVAVEIDNVRTTFGGIGQNEDVGKGGVVLNSPNISEIKVIYQLETDRGTVITRAVNLRGERLILGSNTDLFIEIQHGRSKPINLRTE